MAERSSSLVSLLAAVVVAVIGLVPVIWLLTSPAEQSAVEEGVVVEQPTASSEDATPSSEVAASSPEVTTVVVDPIPELEVDELDPSIVRVLQANGYAELAGEPDLGAELPDAVTRVLIDNNAVLTVVEDDQVTEGG